MFSWLYFIFNLRIVQTYNMCHHHHWSWVTQSSIDVLLVNNLHLTTFIWKNNLFCPEEVFFYFLWLTADFPSMSFKSFVACLKCRCFLWIWKKVKKKFFKFGLILEVLLNSLQLLVAFLETEKQHRSCSAIFLCALTLFLFAHQANQTF